MNPKFKPLERNPCPATRFTRHVLTPLPDADVDGTVPIVTPPIVDETPLHRNRAWVGPSKAELLELFDPTRTFLDPEDEEDAEHELAQLERAGLKSKKIVVPNGGWGPKRRKRRSAHI